MGLLDRSLQLHTKNLIVANVFSLCVRAGLDALSCQPTPIQNRSKTLELTTSARMTQNECYAVGLCQTNKFKIMYKITVDSDKITFKNKIVSATSILEQIGEEPNDCILVSTNNMVFKGNIDLSVYKKFVTVHPDYIGKDWKVVS